MLSLLSHTPQCYVLYPLRASKFFNLALDSGVTIMRNCMHMFILDNVPLSAYSTMRLGGPARHLVEITNKFEVQKAVEWANERGFPVIMIGDGSNIIWQDEGFPGLVIVNRIPGFEIFSEDDMGAYLTVGGGENWDSVVQRVVEMGYSGIEELSLIPGTAGATPVQNVGAYGREIADVLTTVEAFDTQAGQLIMIRGSECDFSYRSSRFKGKDRGRYLITGITFRVLKAAPKPPFYDSLSSYLKLNNITDFTSQKIRDAVIAIRNSKLPDPKLVANNGSFFQNPIISREQLTQIQGAYPEVMYWQMDDGNIKVSAAWLLQTAGFKDFHDEATGMATWKDQPLVLVNEHAKTTHDLLIFRQKIIETVKQQFTIELSQEPELLP